MSATRVVVATLITSVDFGLCDDTGTSAGSGMYEFMGDALDNFRGKPNTLWIIPLFFGLAWCLASMCVANWRPIPTWCVGAQQRAARNSAWSSTGRTSVLGTVTADIQKTPVFGRQTFMELGNLLVDRGDQEIDYSIHSDPAKTYDHLALLGALFMAVSVTFFAQKPQAENKAGVQVHGIVWCSATYVFWAQIVLSVVYSGILTRLTSDPTSRQYLHWWRSTMGGVTLALPFIFAAAGFMLLFYGTTQYFINHFYHAGGHSPDFSLCAGSCYGMVPFVIYGAFKVIHSQAAIRSIADRTVHLELDDVTKCFDMYLDELQRKGSRHSYLEANVEDFLTFISKQRIVQADGLMRGGSLKGMLKEYAVSLVEQFYALHKERHEQFAKDEARKAFNRLQGDVESSLCSEQTDEQPDVERLSPEHIDVDNIETFPL